LIVHPKKTDDDTIIKKYIKIKTYAEVVISFLLNALRHKQPEAIAKNLQKLSSTTTSILYATKTLKDIKQDIDRVSETEDIFIQNRYQTLRELAIKLYTSISLIIDDKHVNNKKNLEVVAETLSMIEKSEEIFITISSNEIMI
jgi:nitric oxide reductase activation protein